MDCSLPHRIIMSYFLADDRCATFLHGIYYWAPPSFSQYLSLFALTCLFELPIYFLALKRLGKLKAILLILGVNLLTHPAVVYLSPLIGTKYFVEYRNLVLIAEILVPLIEALAIIVFMRNKKALAFTAAITANIFSWFGIAYWF